MIDTLVANLDRARGSDVHARLGLEDGKYAVALSAAEGEHDVPGCDGLRIDLDALWAEADRLTAG